MGIIPWFFSIIERAGLKKVLDKSKLISAIYTFFVVNLGWVLFRAEDTLTGLRYMARMMLPWRYQGIHLETWNYMDIKTVFIFGCALLGMGIIKSITPKRVKDYWNGSVIESIYCIILLVLCLASIASDTYNPFIYFRF